jgi:glycosyltransferase involved in cell wall biosynthesis
VREAAGVGVRVVPAAPDALFGDVLQAAAEAADGDVLLKMDDDDWYAPDVVADLLRARTYSGAELVGMPAEFHYLAPRDLTVKRGHPSEFYARFVAGGTMMVDRSVLREVGGFRSVRKYVDAQLLAAVTAAGGAIYRTHGLGYVLRRNESGHTWEVDMDYLLDPSRVQRTWDGFSPSRLMELGSSA